MTRVLMVGLTPPLEGGSERHIYEISSRIPSCKVLTQKKSSCVSKIEVPTLNASSFLRNISFALMCYLYFIVLIFRPRKYDVIHIHENTLYMVAPLLRIRFKVVVTIHGLKGFTFYDKKFCWFILLPFLRSASKIVAVNKTDENLLQKSISPSKIIYIPNGVDLSIYNSLDPRVDKKIVFIGRIHEQKGLIYLLEAFTQISDKYPSFNLEIIGEVNDYAHSLQKKFKNKNIIWKGYMKDRLLIAKSLSSAYCIVLPSLWEGLPLTLFESLASGRPVIVSDISAFSSVIKDEALFFKSENSLDLRNKLEETIENVKKATLLGKKGKQLAQNYDWKNLAKKTHEVYKETTQA